MNQALKTCHQLKAASCAVEKSLTEALSPFGVTYCQAQILCRLEKGQTSMTELAELLCCNKSNVTQVTQGLIKKNLITKTVSSKDRRAMKLELTGEGKMLVHKVEHALKKVAPTCFSNLSESDKKQLSGLLEDCKKSCDKCS